MTPRPPHDPSATDRTLLSTRAYGTGEHLAARQSLYQWQTPRHDLPGIVVDELAGVREERPDLVVVPMDVSHGILDAVPGAVVAVVFT